MARTVRVSIVGDSSSFERAFGRAARSTGTFHGILKGAAFLGAIHGVAKGLEFAVGAAADFEQSLNVFKATAGATGAQMKSVSALAIKLGADTKLPATSAKDAAEAMTELAKGGLSVKDSMQAARGVLQLSAAAQISNADAAQVTADALNAFGLQGKQAVRVADLLAASANASTASIPEMADALKQASAVAKTAHVSIQDTVTSLTFLANAGIKGSDAGTSLKTMLLRLVAPTKKAKEEMHDLGISVFDAHGKIQPFRTILDSLRGGLKGLSDAQRSAALQTIFGTDAFRAASILVAKTPAQYARLQAAVTKQGAASELASARTKGFKGAMESFRSTVETLSIEYGSKLIPALTGFLRAIAGHPQVLIQVAQAAIVATGAFVAFKAALIGVSAAQKIAMIAGEGLISTLGKGNLIAAGVAAVAALAGGLYMLTTRSSAAEVEQRRLSAAMRDQADASRAAAAAIRAQSEATDRLRGARIDERQAALTLREAQAHEKATRGTKDHAQAAIDLARAHLGLRDAQRASTTAAENVIKKTQQANIEEGKRLASLRNTAFETNRNLLTANAFARTQAGVAAANKKANDAERALQAALAGSIAKHQQIAAEARRAAGAVDTTTAAGRHLKAQLEALSSQQLDLSAAIATLSALKGAADSASAGVSHVYSLLRSPPAMPSIHVGTVGTGKGGGGTGGGKSSKELEYVSANAALKIYQANALSLQRQLDGFSARDRQRAVDDATAKLAQARKAGKGVADAEQALASARRAITENLINVTIAREQARAEKIKTLIENTKTKVQAAFASMRERALTAFDAITDRARRAFDAATNAGSALMQQLTGELDLITVRRQDEDAAQAIADAEKALQDARANPESTPADIAAAERAYQRAQEDQIVLGKQRQLAAEQASWTTRRDAEVAANELAAADRRDALEKELTALETGYGRKFKNHDDGMKKIRALLASYGVKFADVGEELGTAFLGNLSATIGSVVDFSIIFRGLRLKKPTAIKKLAEGGIVKRPTFALVGESGPEAVVPLDRPNVPPIGGGGATYVFNFPNYVGNQRELAAVMRNELVKMGRRQPSVLGGLA